MVSLKKLNIEIPYDPAILLLGIYLEKNEIESFVEMWIDLETVIQSEVSQKEKNKYRILTHVCGT